MEIRTLSDNALSMWVGLELLLEDPELRDMKQSILSDETDGRLIAFLLANADDDLQESDYEEQLQYFLLGLYRIAQEQLGRFPLDSKREKLSRMFEKMLEKKPLIAEAFPDHDEEIFIDGMIDGKFELMDTSVISFGSYLVLEIAERAFSDFDTKIAFLELGESIAIEQEVLAELR